MSFKNACFALKAMGFHWKHCGRLSHTKPPGDVGVWARFELVERHLYVLYVACPAVGKLFTRWVVGPCTSQFKGPETKAIEWVAAKLAAQRLSDMVLDRYQTPASV